MQVSGAEVVPQARPSLPNPPLILRKPGTIPVIVRLDPPR